MIPEAAVEAAARALYPEVREEWRVPPDPWESIPEDDDAKIEAIALARIALEAAAPHLYAQALREAVDAFPLETITAPDNAVVWLARRADEVRPT